MTENEKLAASYRDSIKALEADKSRIETAIRLLEDKLIELEMSPIEK